MGKFIHTVKGLISPEQAGKTMMHEHLLWDQSCYAGDESEDPLFCEFIRQEVYIENLGKVYYNAHRNLDNIVQNDVELAKEEVLYFKKAGGSTIVDVTSIGIGRNPKALLTISEATGINVVMGSGYYIASSHPTELKGMNKVQIASRMMEEFTIGVDDTGIRPGVIGEIGISNKPDEQELIVLRASAIAQKETGAPLFIHPPFKAYAHELLDVIEKEGGDISKVVICHCDPTLDDVDYHHSITKRGAYIEYDQFGLEFPIAMEHGTFWLPRDIDRIRAIQKQIALGNTDRILVSQDVCFKTSLIQYGGWGYGHILRDLIPYIYEEGISDMDLNKILVKNPIRILSF